MLAPDTGALQQPRNRQSHWQSSGAPIAAFVFKTPGNFVTAGSATGILEIPFAELVPIALDEKLTATGTPCATAFAIVDVTGVNVLKSLRARYLARSRERRGWRVRFVQHFEIRMECGEMPWHIQPEIFCEPFRCAMQLRVAVVLAGN